MCQRHVSISPLTELPIPPNGGPPHPAEHGAGLTPGMKGLGVISSPTKQPLSVLAGLNWTILG